MMARSAGRTGVLLRLRDSKSDTGSGSVEACGCAMPRPAVARLLNEAPRFSGESPRLLVGVTVVGELELLASAAITPAAGRIARSVCDLTVTPLTSGCATGVGTVALLPPLGVLRRRAGSISRCVELEGGYLPLSSPLLFALAGLDAPPCLLEGLDPSPVCALGLNSLRCDCELALLLRPPSCLDRSLYLLLYASVILLLNSSLSLKLILSKSNPSSSPSS
jgi:hypothetical protein